MCVDLLKHCLYTTCITELCLHIWHTSTAMLIICAMNSYWQLQHSGNQQLIIMKKCTLHGGMLRTSTNTTWWYVHERWYSQGTWRTLICQRYPTWCVGSSLFDTQNSEQNHNFYRVKGNSAIISKLTMTSMLLYTRYWCAQMIFVTNGDEMNLSSYWYPFV